MTKEFKDRLDTLHNLGLMFNGESYVGRKPNNDFNVHHTEILCDTDEQWNKKIDSLKKEIENRK